MLLIVSQKKENFRTSGTVADDENIDDISRRLTELRKIKIASEKII